MCLKGDSFESSFSIFSDYHMLYFFYNVLEDLYMKKRNILIITFCILCLTFSACGSKETSGAEQSSGASQETEEEKMVNGVPVQDIVDKVQNEYSDIVSAMAEGAYTQVSVEDGIMVYMDGEEIKSIVVSPGVDGDVYRRFFYFDEGKLIFARYEDQDAHTFILHDDALVRWIYYADEANSQNFVNHDLEMTEDFLNWETELTKQAYLFCERGTMEPFSMAKVESVSATSELREGNVLHSAERLIDGSVNNAWVEGAPGYGINEFAVLRFTGAYRISGMRIHAGYQKSDKVYYNNARPEQIRAEFSDGTSEVITLQDVQAVQDITFEKSVVTEDITITILSVYPGSKYEDTVISEVSFY